VASEDQGPSGRGTKRAMHVEKTPKFRHPYDLTYQGGYYILHSARDKHIASSLGL